MDLYFEPSDFNMFSIAMYTIVRAINGSTIAIGKLIIFREFKPRVMV